MVLRSCLSDEYFNHFHRNCAQPTNQHSSLERKKLFIRTTAKATTKIRMKTKNESRNASFKMHTSNHKKDCMHFSCHCHCLSLSLSLTLCVTYTHLNYFAGFFRAAVLTFSKIKCTTRWVATFNLYTIQKKNVRLTSFFLPFVGQVIRRFTNEYLNRPNVYLLRMNVNQLSLYFSLEMVHVHVSDLLSPSVKTYTDFMPSDLIYFESHGIISIM